jgi:hypothetical protein
MTWEDSVKRVYVLCHPEKEPERYRRVIPHLLMRGIPKEKLKIAAPTWGDTLKSEFIFNMYNPFLRRGPLPAFTFKAHNLSRGEISLNFNFYNIILNSISDLSGSDSVLVFESDVHLRRDFTQRLSSIIADLSGQEWDYVSLGEGVGTRPLDTDKSYYAPSKLYKPPHKFVFRCTDSMLLSRKFIEKLHKTFIPFKESLDWELNYQMMIHDGVSFWADPPLAEPGTNFSRGVSTLPC